MNDQTMNIPLRWLQENKRERPAGVTWGVPWREGELKREENLVLFSAAGEPVPVQSWTTAYWPDGSVKWTAHAASVAASDRTGGYVLRKGEPACGVKPLAVKETDETIEVDTGILICRLNRSGASVIRDIEREGKRLCGGAMLVGIREARETLHGAKIMREETFHSEIDRTEVETQGPVRTVVKMTGKHRMLEDGRTWLPFTLRFYFYAGQDTLRIVHSFLFDGDAEQDFIKGLGMSFDVLLEGKLYNRHLRFAGDSGFLSESPQGLMTFRTTGRYQDLYREQTDGKKVAFDPQEDARFMELIDDLAVWDSFKLVQHTADSYTITKRTKEACSWIRAASGGIARGLAYVGGENGGLALGVRHFWQKSPSSLEIHGLSRDASTVTAWFWSPDASAMDLRHYDTVTHLKSSYEGFEELRSTPYGVGNTTELSLSFHGRTPDRETLEALAEEKEDPALLVCEPQRYYDSRATGIWSLVDRSTESKAALEDGMDAVFRFYLEEVEQRRWYGFWDYGDVMHSYDPVRHTWRYDIGGCAWQNTELVPNLWLWTMFLRTGRLDVFRFAEAMTRHTSEVDVYHIGEYAGLGSRHNVLHWGCGCKEARIGMAGLHRMYYYLTADERIGDIMDEVKDADYATAGLDPMRSYYPKDEFVTHTRSGPDWSAFCSNWLTRWERYEDTFYRDKMLTGLDCLKRMPYRLLTGPVFGYDPATGILEHMGDENWGHHLMICMGGAQVWMEMAQLLKDAEFADMIAEYGAFYNLPKEEKARRTSGAIPGKDWNIPMLSTAMMAYAARHAQDSQLAREAWSYLLQETNHWQIRIPLETEPVERSEYICPIREIPWMSTNTAAQWCLNTMICLELIGDQLPETNQTEVAAG
ncbi:hypothetical protein O9H85_01245 [Paenibacillus filicis]|uniref:Tat pathway signal sequence domain protein n=1 Tax=Paenibacillus gyeongsangnamensis TaxID=3388067 RepID=A0ABT4Q2M0_9BACL|nr:hypothetical protein [Paenibacillus filicis]MCZ8511081.1 hypothetical protein [Paenibacillus filicis]